MIITLKKGLTILISTMVVVLIVAQPVFAHVKVRELEKMSKAAAAVVYLRVGYQHILPLGFDHILFILSLFLLSPKLKPLLWQATAFTVAHSITLGLAMYGLIVPPPKIIEPVIALSILYVALENVLSPELKKSRIAVVFLFGLVHGMGFASALGQLGLPKQSYLLSLVMFNIGVELGQVTIILAAYLLLAKWFRDKPYYTRYMVVPMSLLIAVVAGYWTVQRLFF